MVHWCGAQYHDLTAEHADLHTDLADLEAKENQLDDLIRNAELQLQLLNEDKTNAYVTYQVKSANNIIFFLTIHINRSILMVHMTNLIPCDFCYFRIFEIFHGSKIKRSLQ